MCSAAKFFVCSFSMLNSTWTLELSHPTMEFAGTQIHTFGRVLQLKWENMFSSAMLPCLGGGGGGGAPVGGKQRVGYDSLVASLLLFHLVLCLVCTIHDCMYNIHIKIAL